MGVGEWGWQGRAGAVKSQRTKLDMIAGDECAIISATPASRYTTDRIDLAINAMTTTPPAVRSPALNDKMLCKHAIQ